MAFEIFRSLVAWLVILPSAFLTGTFYKGLVQDRDLLIRGILYYALGLATLSYGIVVLSAAHLLTTPFIWTMLFLPILFRVHKMGEWYGWLKELVRSFRPGPAVLSWALLGLFVVSSICLLMGTLTPELGGDALCYQLNLPKIFLQQGSLTPNPLDYNSFFPLLMNNLFLIGLSTGGVYAAKIFHFLCGFLLVLAIKRILQNETGNYALALFIALVIWTTPTVYNLLSTAYIDVALAFYVFLALVTFVRATQDGSKSGFLLSGLLIGCGMSIKYLCAISAIALFFVWLYNLIATRRVRSNLLGGFYFAVGVLVVYGYWLGRNWFLTGNPFFPYFGALFGEASRPVSDVYVYGVGRSWLHYLSVYFNMFLSPGAFGTFSTRIGAFYFLLEPFVLLALLFVPKARKYALFWLVFTAVSFFMGQADRWILPVLPVMGFAAGFGIYWLYGYVSSRLKKIIKFIGGGLAIAILCFYVAAGAYHYRYAYLLFTGQWSIAQYLTSLERTTSVAEWVNENLPLNAKILTVSETRIFYFDRPVVRRIFLEWRLKDSAKFSDPGIFLKELKRNGITHILTRSPLGNKTSFPETSSAVKEILSLPDAVEVYGEDSRNIREKRYHYRLFELEKND